jgi:hypothetical protein
MNDDNSSHRPARPTLKLKSGVQRSSPSSDTPTQRAAPQRPSPVRAKHNIHGLHGPQGADEYMQRMQADMDALTSKRGGEPTR